MLVCSIGQPGGKPILLSALITCRLVFMAFLLNATPGGSSMGSTAYWLFSILLLAPSITDNNIFLSYAFSNLNVNTFPPSPKIISLYALTVLLDHMGNKAKQHDMGLSIVTQDSRAKNDIEASSRRHVKGNGMVTCAPAPLIVW